MRTGLNRCTWLACLAVMLTVAPAWAQSNESEADIQLPESPNSMPMEFYWDFAPEAPGGKLTETGPYSVSRWGNIVLRGRLESRKIVTAMHVVQCGQTGDPATQVTLLGKVPDDLCQGVKALPAGTTIGIINGKTNYHLKGQSAGWTVIDFAQIVGDSTEYHGIPPINADNAKSWYVTSLGALVHNEDGKHVVYAPGETVTLKHGTSFVVAPAIDQQELEAYVIGDAMRGFDDSGLASIGEKKPVPVVGLLLFFGLPLLLIGAVTYGIVRFVRRRRRGALPVEEFQKTGALPPTDAPREP